MQTKINYIVVGILGVAGASFVTGLLVKRHCDKLTDCEIFESEQYHENLLNIATYEIYETRYALKCMVDEMQYDTIMAQVEYKLGEYDKNHPEIDVSNLREKLERHIKGHVKEMPTQATEKYCVELVDGLGYRSALQPDDVERVTDVRRRAYREAVEQQWAEREYPGEEVGSERLAPNGDILDDAYDPREDMHDDYETETDEDQEELIAKSEFDQANKQKSNPIPYIISEDEFCIMRDDFEKISIEYFALDDILMDEDESVMDQNVIGVDNLKEFERTDCPSIFVRNEALGIDYEILYNDGSYHVDILDEMEGETIAKRIWRSWERS